MVSLLDDYRAQQALQKLSGKQIFIGDIIFTFEKVSNSNRARLKKSIDMSKDAPWLKHFTDQRILISPVQPSDLKPVDLQGCSSTNISTDFNSQTSTITKLVIDFGYKSALVVE